MTKKTQLPQNDELRNAAHAGDLEKVKQLIEDGADPNSVDANGAGTLLNFHPKVTKYLLSQGANPDIQRNENILPVLVGVAGFNTDCVKAMLDAGANPDIASEHNGETALHHAVCGDRFEEVKALLEAGADPNKKTIAGKTTYMFWRDARVRGETSLHRAAAYGTPEVIQLLLDNGADPTIKDVNNDTPLSWASWHHRDKSIIDMLYYKGSGVGPDYPPEDFDLELSGKALAAGKEQPRNDELVAAALAGNLDKVKQLIEGGADPNSVDANGMGPLLNWHPEVTKYLLDAGADPNIQRNEDITPVISAVCGNLECVKLMLEAGGDINQASPHNGEAALHHMASGQHVGGIQFLLDAGADPNARTIPGMKTYAMWRDVRCRGETPLHRAAAWGTAETIQTLLDGGADPTIRDANGDSPLSWASWYMRDKVIIDLLGKAMAEEPTDRPDVSDTRNTSGTALAADSPSFNTQPQAPASDRTRSTASALQLSSDADSETQSHGDHGAAGKATQKKQKSNGDEQRRPVKLDEESIFAALKKAERIEYYNNAEPDVRQGRPALIPYFDDTDYRKLAIIITRTIGDGTIHLIEPDFESRMAHSLEVRYEPDAYEESGKYLTNIVEELLREAKQRYAANTGKKTQELLALADQADDGADSKTQRHGDHGDKKSSSPPDSVSSVPPCFKDLAKQGNFNELHKLWQSGKKFDLGKAFERAVTDFRTVKRNKGHQQILEFCIEQGLDPLARVDWINQPALCSAAMYGNAALIEHVSASVGLPENPFVRASVGDVEFLKALAESKGGDGKKALSELRDENGFNLLHYAAGSGLGCADAKYKSKLEDTCKFLIECGVATDLAVENNISITPALMCAWFGGNPNTMQSLLDAGQIDVNDLHQPLEFAFEPHQRSGDPFEAVADVILKNGFDINLIRPDQKRTLLHGSANRGSTQAVTWLLKNDADPNVVDGQGRTPLHVAAIRNTHVKVVELLIQYGANPDARDSDGNTPRDYAVQHARKKVLAFLDARNVGQDEYDGKDS